MLQDIAVVLTVVMLGGALVVIISRIQNEEKRKQELKREHPDCNQLIPGLGRDLSINCLARCSRSDYRSMAMLNQSFKSVINSGELYKLRRNLGIVESWVYFSCEIPRWEAFDPERRIWIRVPRLRVADYGFISSDKESQAVGTQLLVFGKGICGQIIHKYDLLTNSWSSGTKLNHPRSLFASASHGEIAIFAGGSDVEEQKVVGFVELYNSDKGRWRNLPGLKIPRKMAVGIFLDGKFYVIGGVTADSRGQFSSNVITTAEVFNFTTNTWSLIPNMHPPDIIGSTNARSSVPPLLAVVKNELYAAYHREMQLWKYNKRYNFWTKMGMLPARVSSLKGWGIAFKGCGNQLLVMGGPISHGGGCLEIYGWDPIDGGEPEWTLLGIKPFGSFVYNCTVMEC